MSAIFRNYLLLTYYLLTTDYSLRNVFGTRLVLPDQFKNPALRELASITRRVIIKSSSWRGWEIGELTTYYLLLTTYY